MSVLITALPTESIAEASERLAVSLLREHTPGGQSHDQSRHGRKGAGGSDLTDRQKDAAILIKAEDHFGLTEDPREAGYVLPDGGLLDFSGKNEGGSPGSRNHDHRQIEAIIDDEGWTKAMHKFMGTGAMRHHSAGGIGYVNVISATTDSQVRFLSNRMSDGAEYTWDIQDTDGATLTSGRLMSGRDLSHFKDLSRELGGQRFTNQRDIDTAVKSAREKVIQEHALREHALREHTPGGQSHDQKKHGGAASSKRYTKEGWDRRLAQWMDDNNFDKSSTWNKTKGTMQLPPSEVVHAIADEQQSYDNADPDQETEKSYEVFKDHILSQYEALLDTGLTVEAWKGEGEPYKISEDRPNVPSSNMMRKAVSETGRFNFFMTEKGFGTYGASAGNHPLLEMSPAKTSSGEPMLYNDVFRVTHDAVAHLHGGYSFSTRGEMNAMLVHATTLPKESHAALFSETFAQNAFYEKNKKYAEQNAYVSKHMGVLEDMIVKSQNIKESVISVDDDGDEPLGFGRIKRMPMSELRKRFPERFSGQVREHTPGGQSHDQSTHGRKGLGGRDYSRIKSELEDWGGVLDGYIEGDAELTDDILASLMDDRDGDSSLFDQMKDDLTDKEIIALAIHMDTAFTSRGLWEDPTAIIAGFAVDFEEVDSDKDQTAFDVLDKQEALGYGKTGDRLAPGEITLDGGNYEPDTEPDMDWFVRNHYPTESFISGGTGFVLSDGYTVDMSHGSGMRADDHRSVIPSEAARKRWGWPEETFDSRGTALQETMKRARAIRVNVGRDDLYVDTAHNPTSRQWRTIGDFVNEAGVTELVFDVRTDLTGRRIGGEARSMGELRRGVDDAFEELTSGTSESAQRSFGFVGEPPRFMVAEHTPGGQSHDQSTHGRKHPSATNESEIDRAIDTARKGGFRGFFVDEGKGEATSVFFVDKVFASKKRTRKLTPKKGGSKTIKLYRGVSTTSPSSGHYYSTSKEWAKQFTQTGRESEVREIEVSLSDIMGNATAESIHEHKGPGPHKSGSSQDVHGRKSGGGGGKLAPDARDVASVREFRSHVMTNREKWHLSEEKVGDLVRDYEMSSVSEKLETMESADMEIGLDDSPLDLGLSGPKETERARLAATSEDLTAFSLGDVAVDPGDTVFVRHETTKKWEKEFVEFGIDTRTAPPDSRLGRLTLDKDSGQWVQSRITEPGLFVAPNQSGTLGYGVIMQVKASQLKLSPESEGLGYKTGVQGLHGAKDAIISGEVIPPENIVGVYAWDTAAEKPVWRPNPRNPNSARLAIRDRKLTLSESIREHTPGGHQHDQSTHGRKGLGGTDSDAFRQWFGDSVIVDENGEPLRLFHSTNVGKDFNKFNTDNLSAHFGTLKAAQDRAEDLRQFSVDVVGREHDPHRMVPVYIKIEEPLEMPDLAGLYQSDSGEMMTGEEALARFGEFEMNRHSEADPDNPSLGDLFPMRWESETDFSEYLYVNDHITRDEFWDVQHSPQKAVEVLKKNGIDGIIYVNAVESPGSKSYIPFDKNQIKSATGNSGAWSSDSDDIRESELREHTPGGVDHDQSTHGRKGLGVTSSAAFRSWFRNSQVVNDDGSPRVVFHGTMDEFTEFDPDAGGDFRTLDQMVGAHFANDSDTASAFAFDSSMGWIDPRPDNSIGGNIIPVYLSIENPRIIDQASVFVDGEPRIATDAVAINADILDVVMSNDKPLFVKWATKARNIEGEQAGRIFDTLKRGESIEGDTFSAVTHFDVDSDYRKTSVAKTTVGSYVENYDSGLQNLRDDRGEIISTYKRVLKSQGFDGLRYINTAPMETTHAPGPVEDATVWIPFDKGQAKSATGNRGTWDPERDDIREHAQHDQKSHGRRGASSQTDSAAFRRWFGDSKVVDGDGEPLVVYHGTDADFETFNTNSSRNLGAHFGTSSQASDLFGEDGETAGHRIIPAYIKLKNPLRMPDIGGWEGHGARLQFEKALGQTIPGSGSGQSIRRAVMKSGYDGIVYSNEFEGEGESYIVFSPNQIKSATGNIGTFDPNKDNINEAIREHTPGGQSHDQSTHGRKGGGGGKSGENQGKKGDKQTETPEFKAWFGDSKVVDESGEPLVVHHVTTEEFNEFDPSKAAMGGTFWFTSDKASIESGETGAGLHPDKTQRTIDAYLSVQKMAGWDEYDKLSLGQLEDMGYDGVKLVMDKSKPDGGADYIVFEPTQIKSATGNQGSFDPSNPDIREAIHEHTPGGHGHDQSRHGKKGDDEPQKIIRYAHKDGTGLLNNSGLDRMKLTDDEESELIDVMDFGLQQPGHGVEGTFYFTEEGEEKHRRMIELLRKASKTGVVRTVATFTGEPNWKSSDGQLALDPKQVSDGDT